MTEYLELPTRGGFVFIFDIHEGTRARDTSDPNATVEFEGKAVLAIHSLMVDNQALLGQMAKQLAVIQMASATVSSLEDNCKDLMDMIRERENKLEIQASALEGMRLLLAASERDHIELKAQLDELRG